MLRSEEIGEGPQPPIQVRVVSMLGGSRDRVAEFLARVVFDGQYAVDVTVEAQRADRVVRGADQMRIVMSSSAVGR
jgi:hypothetical protein